MQDRHRYKNRYFRPPPTLYERAQEVLNERGSSVNDYLVECLRLLVGPVDESPADDVPQTEQKGR